MSDQVMLVYPDYQMVDERKIISWANDYEADNDLPLSTTVEEALEVLQDAGLVTAVRHQR